MFVRATAAAAERHVPSRDGMVAAYRLRRVAGIRRVEAYTIVSTEARGIPELFLTSLARVPAAWGPIGPVSECYPQDTVLPICIGPC
jgi:hypothetical protein